MCIFAGLRSGFEFAESLESLRFFAVGGFLSGGLFWYNVKTIFLKTNGVDK
jgi:hypothetical protein